jgi:hypothetical protein
VGVRLAQGEESEPAGLARNRAEQQPLGVVLQVRYLIYMPYIRIEVVMGRKFVLFAASEPVSAAIAKEYIRAHTRIPDCLDG